MELNFIIELERKLLDPTARKNAGVLDELLDEAFVEYGTSGRVYDKKTIIAHLSEEKPVTLDAMDFVPLALAPDVILLRFKTRRKTDDGSFTASLRSSVWKKTGPNWRMVFHQGTRTTP